MADSMVGFLVGSVVAVVAALLGFVGSMGVVVGGLGLLWHCSASFSGASRLIVSDCWGT